MNWKQISGSCYRVVHVLLPLLFALSLQAQSDNRTLSGIENVPDSSSRTYTRADFVRLPSALNPWSLLGHTEVSATIQRFDIGGMHSNEALLFGSRGGSWSQNKMLVNGINVYPREIEEIIYAFAGVKEAAIIGVPDARRGEQPLALK